MSHTKAMMVVDNLLVIEVHRGDGSLAEPYRGPSQDQLKGEHDAGSCDSFCGYCAAMLDELSSDEVDGGAEQGAMGVAEIMD